MAVLDNPNWITEIFENEGKAKMKIPKWFKAGLYFGLFEGIFWFWGKFFFEVIYIYTIGSHIIHVLKGIIGLIFFIISVYFFGLFIKETKAYFKE